MLRFVTTTFATPTTGPDATPTASASALHDWRDETLTISPARWRVAAAWFLLVCIGLCVTVGGFAMLRRFVSRWPRRERTLTVDQRAALQLQMRAALRRASTFYFKQPWCLQKSAVLVCLLRSAGIAAQLVIGVQKLPFHAHAWVEADGAVVNGPATFKTRMLEIERW